MKQIFTLAAAIALTGMLSGCLVTRGEIREEMKPVPPTQQQIQQANQANEMDDLDSEVRKLRGRVGTLENTVNTLNTNRASDLSAMDTRVTTLESDSKIYETELTKLDTEYLQLSQKVEALHASLDQLTKARAARKISKADIYGTATSNFAHKHWQKAIVEFQKYREDYPHGLHYAEATYKIGLAFFKLGMKSESRTFYTEAKQKFPKSIWGKRAAKKLKTLK